MTPNFYIFYNSLQKFLKNCGKFSKYIKFLCTIFHDFFGDFQSELKIGSHIEVNNISLNKILKLEESLLEKSKKIFHST